MPISPPVHPTPSQQPSRKYSHSFNSYNKSIFKKKARRSGGASSLPPVVTEPVPNQITSRSAVNTIPETLNKSELVKRAVPVITSILPTMKEAYIEAHRAALVAARNKDETELKEAREMMKDLNKTVRMALATINSITEESHVATVRNLNQIVTQLIINPTNPATKLSDFFDPKIIWNLNGHKDLTQIGTSWIAVFASYPAANEAEKKIISLLPEDKVECIEIETFSHTKFLMRSALINCSLITEAYGNIDSQETIKAIRKDLFNNNRYFTKDSDIVDIKIKRKGNIHNATEVFIELSVTLHTFDRAKVHPRDAGVMVHLNEDIQVKVKLYNQYFPQLCKKCFRPGHATRECPALIGYCGDCGKEHFSEACDSASYECPICREDKNLSSTHRPTSFSCPSYKNLSRALQQTHYDSVEGFKSLLKLDE